MFNERVKLFKVWKDAEASLTKKSEERSKLEMQRKLDKIPAVSQEITKVRKADNSVNQDTWHYFLLFPPSDVGRPASVTLGFRSFQGKAFILS